MIEVNQITKYYGSVKAVDSVSFNLKQGEVVGFLGPNGAGKTTTMRILTGFLPASSGSCRIANLDLATQSLEIRKKIGYLPESTPLYGNMEVTEYLSYIGKLRCLSKSSILQALQEVIPTCGLKSVLGKKIATLSKGYKQRVGLAQALLHKPDILILDEPTVGLDPNQIVEIRELIKEIGKNKTILLSTHILSEVQQTCERVLIISEGKIVGQGTPSELIHQTHSTPIYYVSVRGPQDKIIKAFKDLPQFKNIEILSSQESLHNLKVALVGEKNRSEEIFKTVVDSHWSLAELKREEASLETIFKELTKN